jgi:hypothetical protein
MAQQLQTIDLVTPGSLGINREVRARLLPPAFCSVATNFRINKEGLLASRLGQTDQTTTAIGSTPNIESLFEYIDASGNVEMIQAWDGGIGNNIDDPEGNDVSGSLTDTNGTWWFRNFNDKCLAFQSGQKLAIYTGTTFATVVESSGTASTSGIAGVAYGRVWQADNSDGANLLYSGLLDEADWGGAGAGSIDFSKIWTDGQDRITAIVGFNGALVVFGMNHIVFIIDGTGSELGLNPANAYVVDVISGTGCVDQQTIQEVGETELLYMSKTGVQSLARVIQEKSNPTNTVSKAVTTDIVKAYRAAAAGTLRSAYNEDEGMYVITFTDQSVSYMFDTRTPYGGEAGQLLYPVFKWDLAPSSWASRDNGDLLMGGAGNVYKYSGFTDDGTKISLEYESPWLELGEELGNRLKILKKIGAIIFTALDGNVVYKWSTDFDTSLKSYTKAFVAPSGASEWGVAEWGLDAWSGPISLSITRIPARITGQYFKVGLSADVDTAFSIQQVELFAKIGRAA